MRCEGHREGVVGKGGGEVKAAVGDNDPQGYEASPYCQILAFL